MMNPVFNQGIGLNYGLVVRVFPYLLSLQSLGL